MEHVELILLFLLVAVAVLTGLAQALRVPYPILLVVGGSVLGFMPGVPHIELEPDLVLLIFLPPLLFNAAYFASLRELRADARAISLSAVGMVLLTMCAVAVVMHAVVPHLPWAAAFALGAIVSPTDPLAAVAIARRLGAPRRLVAIIEGEALVNDGTALVAYRTAVAVAVGGSFSLLGASGDFLLGIVGGALVGIVVGQLLTWVLRRVADDFLGVTISLVAGYLAYLPAEELRLSGVIAAVTVGLMIGHRASDLSSPGARLRGYAFWDVLVFLLNAVLFVLVGLQLPGILEDQDRSAGALIGLGALAGAVVIATRLVWMHTMPFVVRLLDRRPRQVGRRVDWRRRTVVAWSGLRGAVSLAAALALPQDFPGAGPAHLAHALRDLHDARPPGAHPPVADPRARRSRRRRGRARGDARPQGGGVGGDRPPRGTARRGLDAGGQRQPHAAPVRVPPSPPHSASRHAGRRGG
jgi:monovalent cation/hydrogen antiporter